MSLSSKTTTANRTAETDCAKARTADQSDRRNAIIASAYSESRPRVYGYILKNIADRTDAEDLTQEVFVRLLEYRAPIDESTIMNFIFSIAHNLIIDYLRHNAHRTAASEYFFIHSKADTDCTSEHISASDIIRIERSCIADMPARKREVYILSVHYGRSAKNVAQTLNLSRRTVENHLFAARKMMKRAFAMAI